MPPDVAGVCAVKGVVRVAQCQREKTCMITCHRRQATLLALGNSAPDLVSSLVAFHSADDAVDMAIGELIGAGLFVGTVVVGLVVLCGRPAPGATKPLTYIRLRGNMTGRYGIRNSYIYTSHPGPGITFRRYLPARRGLFASRRDNTRIYCHWWVVRLVGRNHNAGTICFLRGICLLERNPLPTTHMLPCRKHPMPIRVCHAPGIERNCSAFTSAQREWRWLLWCSTANGCNSRRHTRRNLHSQCGQRAHCCSRTEANHMSHLSHFIIT